MSNIPLYSVEDQQLLTGTDVNSTNPLVKTSNGPSSIARGVVQRQVGVVGNVTLGNLESQVLQLRVIHQDDIDTGGYAIVASELVDELGVLGESQELLVSGSVCSEDEGVDVGVGEADVEVVFYLREECDRAESSVAGSGGTVGSQLGRAVKSDESIIRTKRLC
jgi:hypothetical protein